MRISDWSSDVCSSDLAGGVGRDGGRPLLGAGGEACEEGKGEERLAHQWLLAVKSTPRPASTTIPTTNSTTRRGIRCSRRASVPWVRTADARAAKRRVGTKCVRTFRSPWQPHP